MRVQVGAVGALQVIIISLITDLLYVSTELAVVQSIKGSKKQENILNIFKHKEMFSGGRRGVPGGTL